LKLSSVIVDVAALSLTTDVSAAKQQSGVHLNGLQNVCSTVVSPKGLCTSKVMSVIF